MLEVWGRGVAIRYGNGRLVTQPLRADDEVALDVPVSELHRIRVATTDDDRIAVLLYFRSPEFPMNGVPTQRHPVPIFLEPELRPQATELVRAVEGELLEARRLHPRRPDLTPPPLLPSPHGPMRQDVTAAARRMRFIGHTTHLITALQTLAGPDEFVLELAQATHSGTPGLIAITTQRFLFVGADAVHELPIAAIDRAEVTPPPAPRAVATLRLRAYPTTLEFVDWVAEDFARLAQAVQLACDVAHVDGSILPARPSSADLFAEWQLLVERRRLGMVEDEAFQRQAFGIMGSLPS
ncbi:hypothetical protein GPX89_24305 [Nocardia sp. ET3-3]|uniref:Uncharacterized protein n=1 Tax=Nocardia terrae TaxID=2675851 RepID=A0A7K1V1P6_9NOCA|nr:hypothetical protein [Nocardia terrae]MVU80359.1 hypothetical protein [Nocardia terrae]